MAVVRHRWWHKMWRGGWYWKEKLEKRGPRGWNCGWLAGRTPALNHSQPRGPMAPTTRPSRQLQEHQQLRPDVIPPQPEHGPTTDAALDVSGKTIFIDPMMGTPLQIYIEKDVEDIQDLAKLIEVRHPRLDVSSSYLNTHFCHCLIDTWRQCSSRLQHGAVHTW